MDAAELGLGDIGANSFGVAPAARPPRQVQSGWRVPRVFCLAIS
jgi:hypothetical protein